MPHWPLLTATDRNNFVKFMIKLKRKWTQSRLLKSICLHLKFGRFTVILMMAENAGLYVVININATRHYLKTLSQWHSWFFNNWPFNTSKLSIIYDFLSASYSVVAYLVLFKRYSYILVKNSVFFHTRCLYFIYLFICSNTHCHHNETRI